MGQRNFRDRINIPLQDAGDIRLLSEKMSATGILFWEVVPSYNYDFHNEPEKQYIILMDSEIEIEISFGEKRFFKAGDILLVEDTKGKGHKTRNLQSIKKKSIFITIP